jgi:hypothetical protein
MPVVEVLPGVCGLNTRIVAHADDMYNVTLEITSDCEHIKQLAVKLTEISALDELMRPINETTPYRLAGNCRTHAACPVPSAILKAIEVAAGMALPADVHMTIRKS